jgi:hypothetical protein
VDVVETSTGGKLKVSMISGVNNERKQNYY